MDPAEASRSPDRDLPVHSSPEFLHTNVNTPISKSINQSNNSIFQRERERDRLCVSVYVSDGFACTKTLGLVFI